MSTDSMARETEKLLVLLETFEARTRDRVLSPEDRAAVERLLASLGAALRAIAAALPPTEVIGHSFGADHLAGRMS